MVADFDAEFGSGADPNARKEEDFLFGSISAAKYQEFNVIKINKRSKRQTRVIGIDGFNIYNIRKHRAKEETIVVNQGSGNLAQSVQ